MKIAVYSCDTSFFACLQSVIVNVLAYYKLFTFNKCYSCRYGKYNKAEAVPHIKISSKIIIQIQS